MDRLPTAGRYSKARIPHTRGDGPVVPSETIDDYKYSPHAWGWTDGQVIFKKETGVFPTRVGMDHPVLLEVGINIRIPHTRGDGPPA